MRYIVPVVLVIAFVAIAFYVTRGPRVGPGPKYGPSGSGDDTSGTGKPSGPPAQS